MTTGKNLYPAFIIFAIGSFICFLGWSAMRAADSGPQVTDADYYSKGLRYTSTVLEKKAAATLGWQVSTKLVDRTLEFQLRDNQGQPVKGASGTISLFLANTSSSVQFPLQEIAAGLYHFNLTANMTGEMTARLEFERKDARLNRQLLLSL